MLMSTNTFKLHPHGHQYETVQRGGRTNIECIGMSCDQMTSEVGFMNSLGVGQLSQMPIGPMVELIDADVFLTAMNFTQVMSGYLPEPVPLTANRLLVFPDASVIIAAMASVMGNFRTPGATFDFTVDNLLGGVYTRTLTASNPADVFITGNPVVAGGTISQWSLKITALPSVAWPNGRVDLVLLSPPGEQTMTDYDIELQLCDVLGFPVNSYAGYGNPAGTPKFTITVTAIVNGPLVTLKFPQINFQVGPASAQTIARFPSITTGLIGGFLFTSDGFLPESIRPADMTYCSALAASNNGVNPVTLAGATLPNIPMSYIVQVTNSGSLCICGPSGPNNFQTAVYLSTPYMYNNAIPPGNHSLLPFDLSYVVKPITTLTSNVVVSSGVTNTTGFTGPAANVGLRDSHVCDTFQNVVAVAWSDNSRFAVLGHPAPTNNTGDCMVCIGSVSNSGVVTFRSPINLTNTVGPDAGIFDTAVAISRTNPLNIVVSFGYLDAPNHYQFPAISISNDGGFTWHAPIYSILDPPFVNISPVFGVINVPGSQLNSISAKFGDERGVSSDRYGNIWYMFSNDVANPPGYPLGTIPRFYVSTNNGQSFSLLYSVTNPGYFAYTFYDYPQMCFGGGPDPSNAGMNTYGMWFSVDYENLADFGGRGSIVQARGFIPIYGLGSFGTPDITYLNQLIENQYVADITASADGRTWTFGPGLYAGTTAVSVQVLYGSPGPIDNNYAGPWDVCSVLAGNLTFTPGFSTSQPVDGYIYQSVKSIIYDDARQALYAVIAHVTPDSPAAVSTPFGSRNSQNMRISLMISRNNGQNWSAPITVNTSDVANRGYQSMALDTASGNLLISWYDGRQDPSFQSLQYMATVVPAAMLTAMVNAIPLSNPAYHVPLLGFDAPAQPGNLTPHSLLALAPVLLTTAAALPNAPTYTNGAQTLTATTNGFLVVDGVAPIPGGSRILVNNQVDSRENGVYVVTNQGSPATQWILTRSSDFDQAALPFPNGIIVYSLKTPGAVQNGGTTWVTTSLLFVIDPLTQPVVLTLAGGALSSFSYVYQRMERKRSLVAPV